MMKEFKNIIYTTDQSIACIFINRPDKMNALNQETLQELEEVLVAFQNDNTLKAAVISGVGEKAFVAGADIREFQQLSEDEAKALSVRGQKLFAQFIHSSTKPVVAAINGFALGGGLELAMACHFRIASANAKFGLPEVSLGIIPGYGGTQRLAKLVGEGYAMQMILTGDMIDAKEALRIGLVNEVISPEELLLRVKQLLNTILERSSTAVSAAIQAIQYSNSPAVEGFRVEAELFAKQFSTADCEEGISAFLSRRRAEFK